MDTLRPFRQIAPDQLEVREGGGCMAFFGLPFFLAGIFITLTGFGLIRLDNAEEVPFWGWPLIVLMGLVFTAVGGGLAFGRRWTIIDRSAGTIMQQWGLLTPMKQALLNLHDYRAVTLSFDAGDSDSADQYPVRLKNGSSSQDLSLYSSTTYNDSRERAALLAEFLHLPLEDATSARTTRYEVDQLDESLQERLVKGKAELDSIARPLQMRSQTAMSNGVLQIVIPGPGFHPLKLVQFVFPLAIALFFVPGLHAFFVDTETPLFVQYGFIGFLLLFFVGLPLISGLFAIIDALRRHTRILVSSSELLIKEQGAWQTRTTRLPVGEIIDLDCQTGQLLLSAAQQSAAQRVGQSAPAQFAPLDTSAAAPRWLSLLSKLAVSRGITVKSKRGLFTFGAGLPDHELEYLHASVRRALAGIEG